MHNLFPLNDDTIREFDFICESKNEPTYSKLNNLRSSIVVKYDEYDTHYRTNTLESIDIVSYLQPERDALLHCYGSKTVAKDNLIAKIKENQPSHLKSTCQFCGMNSTSTTDHFLPKGIYPEFCVNHKNLIPCCFQCNNLKNEYLIDERTGTRGIINLYLDQLPTVQFLFLNIRYLDDIPIADFNLNNSNGINSSLFQVIQYHYEKLRLKERYRDEFNSLYKQTLSAYSNPIYDASLVRQSLLFDARSLYHDFGRNYYKAIIKESLANNNTFLNLFNR